MQGLPRFLFLALLAVAALAPAALADEPPLSGSGHGMRGLRRCLSQTDLSEEQKSQIQSLVGAARPGLQVDRQALHADHQKLTADLAAGADACALGRDVLARHADAEKWKNDLQTLRGKVLATLTADQQNAVQGCLQNSTPRHWSGRSGT